MTFIIQEVYFAVVAPQPHSLIQTRNQLYYLVDQGRKWYQALAVV